jgi:hypothetical protein
MQVKGLIDRQYSVTIIQHDAPAKFFLGGFGQTSQSFSICGVHAGRRFNFHAPDTATNFDDQIDFDLIFVSVMIKTNYGTGTF